MDESSVVTRRALLAGGVCGAAVAVSGCRPKQSPHAPAPPVFDLGLRGVDLVDPAARRVHRDRTIWIAGGVVTGIEDTKTAAPIQDPRIVDLSGKTAIPGLFDMHAHLPDAEPDDAYSTEHYLAMQLAAGVTGIRSMRGTTAQLALRDRLATQELVGPKLWVGGILGTVDAAAAEASVRQLARDGFDFIKLLGDLDADAYRIASRTARDEDLALAGHVPQRVPLADILQADQCIEHLQGIVGFGAAAPAPEATAELIASGCYSCPTLDFMTVWFGLRDPAELRRRHGLAWVGAHQRERWDRWQRTRVVPDEKRVAAQAWLDHALATVAKLDAGHAPLLASPSHGPWIVPGFGLLPELELLERAGLDRFAVLRAATSAAARWLGHDGAGRTDVGARADLVVLDHSPLDDLQNLREPHAVITAGRYHVGADLRAALSQTD